ncbi:hypothetical protein B0J18DRAFT_417903, partial [Chaetomium sp. MPI-SDFR-AT-0129]
MKAQIKHLAGGRLEEEEEEEEEREAEGSTRNTTVLAPMPKRAQKSRASSMDSRVTQWLDFYTGPPELGKSPLHLPAQSKQPGTGTAVLEKKGGGESERDPEPATSSRSQQNTSSELGDPGFLPLLRFGAPPPTPDSSAGGAAKTHLGQDKGKGKEEDGALPLKPKGYDDATVTRDKAQPNTETDDSVRHTSTRQDRIWLHINYRGEAPFLQAWGLDITKPADRIEGLAILRELIQAEGERNSVEGAQAVVQGSTSPLDEHVNYSGYLEQTIPVRPAAAQGVPQCHGLVVFEPAGIRIPELVRCRRARRLGTVPVFRVIGAEVFTPRRFPSWWPDDILILALLGVTSHNGRAFLLVFGIATSTTEPYPVPPPPF